MSGLDWHPRFHGEALDGMRPLTLEERGAYNTLLDLMYQRGGPVPDDDRWLAGWMGVSVRRWKAIRESLIGYGKIQLEQTDKGDVLTNPRAAAELANQTSRRKKLAENGAKGGERSGETRRARSENSDLAEAKTKHKTETVTGQSSVSSLRSDTADAEAPPVDQTLVELSELPREQGAWRLAKLILVERGRMKTEAAGKLVGGWVKNHGLTVEQLWEIAEACWRNGTDDPKAYLAAAAKQAAERRKTPGAIDAPSERQQRAWMEDWRDKGPPGWRRHERGPQPGEAGCRVSADLQRNFGVTPSPEPPVPRPRMPPLESQPSLV